MERNLGALRALLTQAGGLPLRAMEKMGGKAGAAAALLLDGSEETAGNILATMHAHTEWLDSRAMREALRVSNFSLRDLNNGRTTIYPIIQPQYLPVHSRLLRLFINQAVGAVGEGRKRKHPTLIICDEAHATGPLEIMKKSAGVIRGYGVRLWWIFQTATQLVDLYPRNWEVFFATSGQIQMFAINNKVDAESLSQALGRRAVWKKRKIRDGRGRVVRVEWEPAGSVPLRDPAEVARLIGRESGLQIVLNEGGDPFLLRRTPYDKTFPEDHYAPDPMELRPPPVKERLLALIARLIEKTKETST